VDATGTATRQLGLARDQLIGTPWSTLLDPAAAGGFAEAAGRAAPEGPQLILQAGLRAAGGRLFPAELGLRQVRQAGQDFLVVVARDVTEREQMRGRLAVADRMVSIGTLAAGVAHEINNPLAYVLGNLDHVRRELGRLRRDAAAGPGLPAGALAARMEDAETALAEALEGAERVRQIVRDLKKLSRAGDGGRGPVDLRQVVDAAASMVAHEIRQRAQLVKEYRTEARVEANEGRLTQVLLNLLVNAAQAIPEGQVHRNVIRVVVNGTPEVAVLEVQDTGGGIRPEHLARVFDPFFTTKPVGVGTGLGLSICHGIVTDLGGTIEVESTPGRGTTFRIRLPAVPSATAPQAEAAPPATRQARRARVLVVDDDPMAGRAVGRLLGADHDVTVHTSPRQALTQLRDGQRFDAVICDVMMPDLDGKAFYEELEEVAPELTERVVFVTGGAFTERTEAFLRGTTAPSLEKPFSQAALQAAIEMVMGR